jgi:hypothetical protein
MGKNSKRGEAIFLAIREQLASSKIKDLIQ